MNIYLAKFLSIKFIFRSTQDEKHWLVATIETKLFIWKYEMGKKVLLYRTLFYITARAISLLHFTAIG